MSGAGSVSTKPVKTNIVDVDPRRLRAGRI